MQKVESEDALQSLVTSLTNSTKCKQVEVRSYQPEIPKTYFSVKGKHLGYKEQLLFSTATKQMKHTEPLRYEHIYIRRTVYKYESIMTQWELGNWCEPYFWDREA